MPQDPSTSTNEHRLAEDEAPSATVLAVTRMRDGAASWIGATRTPDTMSETGGSRDLLGQL